MMRFLLWFFLQGSERRFEKIPQEAAGVSGFVQDVQRNHVRVPGVLDRVLGFVEDYRLP